MNFKKISILLLGTMLSASSLSAQELGAKLSFSGLIEYDEIGNKIHEKDNYSECWYEYDADGKITHSTISDEWENTEFWFTYDSEGRIFGQRFEGGEYWFEYDEKNHKIIQHGGHDNNWIYNCDQNWNRLHGTNGYIEWWAKYDADGNQTFYRDMDGFDTEYEYDSKKRLVKKSEYNEKYITNYEYDSYGNLIRETSNYNPDKWYVYTYWDNGKIKSQRQFTEKSDQED